MLKNLLILSILISSISCAQKKSYYSSPDFSKSENPKELSEFFYNYEKQTGKTFFIGKPNFANHYEINFVEKDGNKIGKMIDSETGVVYDLPEIAANCKNYSGKIEPLYNLNGNTLQIESCNLQENAPFFYIYKWDEAKKKFLMESMAREIKKSDTKVTSLNFNPDANMDKTLSMLDYNPTEESKKIEEFLTFRNDDHSLDEDYRFSDKMRKLWRDMIDLEYEGAWEGNTMTQKKFDAKWKGKVDFKYLGWDHFGWNGNDEPDIIKVYPSKYLGELNGAYYYRMNMDSLDPDWPDLNEDNGKKIYKVEKINGNYLITGIFQRVEE